MDLHAVMISLQQATGIDLLRLRAAIDHLLQSPNRILAIRRHLQLGQEVRFWNVRLNRMHHGRLAKFKPDQVLILTEARWESKTCPSTAERSAWNCFPIRLIDVDPE